jgi:hypothetical protein
MAFDFDSEKLRGLYFVKIFLEDQTLRYSNESTYARDTDSTFQFFEGRLFGISNTARGFNDFRDGSSITSSMTLRLRNGVLCSGGDNLDSIVLNNNLSNIRVQVFLTDFETEDPY